MSQEDTRRDEKRQKALERLRANRGKARVANKTKQEAKADEVKILIKDYRDSYRSHKDQLQEPENQQRDQPQTDTEKLDPQSLPKIAKASKWLQEKQEKTSEAIERLKESRKRFKEIRKAKKAESVTPKIEAEPAMLKMGAELITPEMEEAEEDIPSQVKLPKRQQLRHDLLSADFFKSASKWLSSINVEPRPSSSSIEEVEFLYKEAKLRYKVLKIMLDDTQKELDSFEVYLRMAKSTSKSASSD